MALLSYYVVPRLASTDLMVYPRRSRSGEAETDALVIRLFLNAAPHAAIPPPAEAADKRILIRVILCWSSQ